MRLPPGVTSADFSAAIKQFEAAIGKEWVFTSDEDVDLYRDSYSPLWHEEDEPIPSAAVAPDGIEQIQAIVKIANAYKIPLWTISTGKEPGLRRVGAASGRQCGARPQAHEPGARGQ